MDFSQANDLLKPGYLPFESGYRDLENGKKVVAALTRMPRCRAKMVNWWFGWLGGTDHYKLWHPRDHVFSDWENRKDGNYIGASHIVHEYFGTDGPVHQRRLDFHDPLEIFDAATYRAAGVVAVCARSGELESPISSSRVIHFVRDTDYGCEMRSRFFLGEMTERRTGAPVPEEHAAPMRRRIPADLPRRLHRHAVEEMGYLADLLPVLYRQVTGDASF